MTKGAGGRGERGEGGREGVFLSVSLRIPPRDVRARVGGGGMLRSEGSISEAKEGGDGSGGECQGREREAEGDLPGGEERQRAGGERQGSRASGKWYNDTLYTSTCNMSIHVLVYNVSPCCMCSYIMYRHVACARI